RRCTVQDERAGVGNGALTLPVGGNGENSGILCGESHQKRRGCVGGGGGHHGVIAYLDVHAAVVQRSDIARNQNVDLRAGGKQKISGQGGGRSSRFREQHRDFLCPIGAEESGKAPVGGIRSA